MMQAERIHNHGGPEGLCLEDIPMPKPGAREILVRICAAGVNPVDWKLREGQLGQLTLPAIMGSDFSGVVEELGSDVEEFRVGQEVFGSVADNSGSYAEYAIAPVSQVTEKPAGLDHFQAAALPIASLTAWQALFDAGNLQTGQRALIHAAAGGVGSFAVQLARWKGASAIGTASAQHLEFVRMLGASQVIDYRSTRFEDVARDLDVVLDTVGGETQERSWSVLRPSGILVSTVRPPSEESAAVHQARGTFIRCDHSRVDELTQVANLVVSGEIKVYVETVLPLSEAAHAQELSRKGHTQGKIVLRVF
ncbi:MAG TPA: NADP-dependent oxidoreductase [Candidatus Dormibacteraeota bacterium]|nr:NADP-dependent oxidoreductase [Candidatus Dormibacteraeota bacterium]